MKNQQNSTLSTLSTLSTEQAEVIAALVTGANVTSATKAAGVDRGTFYKWMKNDADFAAELNRAQKEREIAFRAQLDSLTDEALDALHEMLDREIPPAVRLKAALEILARGGQRG
jgi:hypothetical protein